MAFCCHAYSSRRRGLICSLETLCPSGRKIGNNPRNRWGQFGGHSAPAATSKGLFSGDAAAIVHSMSLLYDTYCRYCQVRPLWTRMESRQPSVSMLEGTSQLSLRPLQCSYHCSSFACRRPVDIDARYTRTECIITTYPTVTSDTVLQLGNRVAADLRNNRIILMDIIVSGSHSPHCVLGLWCIHCFTCLPCSCGVLQLHPDTVSRGNLPLAWGGGRGSGGSSLCIWLHWERTSSLWYQWTAHTAVGWVSKRYMWMCTNLNTVSYCFKTLYVITNRSYHQWRRIG